MCWIKLNSLEIITKTCNLSNFSDGNRNTNIKKIKKKWFEIVWGCKNMICQP